MTSGRGFSGPAWQDCSAVWAGQPAQAQVPLLQPERRRLYRIVRTRNQGWQHKKHKKHLKTTSYCFFGSDFFFKYEHCYNKFREFISESECGDWRGPHRML
jgi:hypothetical protein